ncbi:hypothetical protein FKM82_022600 [Ascaphus truei]
MKPTITGRKYGCQRKAEVRNRTREPAGDTMTAGIQDNWRTSTSTEATWERQAHTKETNWQPGQQQRGDCAMTSDADDAALDIARTSQWSQKTEDLEGSGSQPAWKQWTRITS